MEASGEVAQNLLGVNETEGANLRFERNAAGPK
jgi:YD repeat-containing protein